MFALAACAALTLTTAAQEHPSRDVQALRAEIAARRDDVPAEVIAALAAIGTREAAEALIAGYDDVASTWMRREIARALARCDAAAELAFAKLADVAIAESAPELHEEAVDLLAAAPALGRPYLREIAETPAGAAVRERAMLRHVETFAGSTDDLAWYRELFDAAPEGDERAGDAPRAPALVEIRELALTRIAPLMEDAELVELAEGEARDRLTPRLDGIRRIALDELVARGSKHSRKVAERVFEDVKEAPENRAAAARALLALQGPPFAKRLLAAGSSDAGDVPMVLRRKLAELLAEMDHEPTEKKLAAELGQAQGEHALFCLWALAGEDGAALEDELLAHIDDDDRVALLAIERLQDLGAGASPKAVEALEELLDGEWQEPVAAAALEALSRLRAGDPEWSGRLVEFTSSAEREPRNAALELLGAAEPAAHAEVFTAALAHADWSTRLTALGVLERRRTREATGAIVARMPAETGLVLLRFGEALTRLSGQPFDSNAGAWKRWWDDAGPRFEPIGAAELAALAAGEEQRRLRQVTAAADCFGLRIDSKRVLFVLDISTSMGDPIAGPLASAPGELRLQVAQRELTEALASLADDTLFNLATFTNVVDTWRPGGLVAATPSAVEEVSEHVERLGFGGATDLTGPCARRLSDPEVDTIVLLSDGQAEGSMRVEVVDDPCVIRTDVALWNEYRNVTIHTVAIGEELEILEWLARDSGGRHVRARYLLSDACPIADFDAAQPPVVVPRPCRGRLARLKPALRVLVSAAAAAVLLWILARWGGIEPGEVVATLQRLSLSTWALAFAAHLGIFAARGLRYHLLLPRGERPSLTASLAIGAAHNLAVYVLPARSGEATLVLYLKGLCGVPASSGVAVLIVSRALDMATLAASFSLVTLWLAIGGQWTLSRELGLGLGASLFAMTSLFTIASVRGEWLVGAVGRTLDLCGAGRTAFGARLLERGRELSLALQSTRSGGRLAISALLSLGVWIGVFVVFAILARGFGLPSEIGFPEAAFGSSLAVMTNVLPVNALAGFGTQETGWVLGFGLLGVERDLAFSTGVSVHLVQLAHVIAFGALGHLVMGLLRSAPAARGPGSAGSPRLSRPRDPEIG